MAILAHKLGPLAEAAALLILKKKVRSIWTMPISTLLLRAHDERLR